MNCNAFGIWSIFVKWRNNQPRAQGFPTIEIQSLDLLNIPDLILKLYVIYKSCFPYYGQDSFLSRENNGKDNKFESNFL